MKTIEITSGDQIAQFTTKSVTFDSKEFFYANMSDVSNDASECVYTFTYDGEIKRLPYEAKDAKVLNAIFSQVQNLKGPKKESAEASKPANEQNEQKAPAENTESTVKANAEPPASESTAAETEETAQTSETAKEGDSDTPVPAEEKADAEGQGAKEEKPDSEGQATKEEKPADPEKRARLRKSIKIFGIVIGAVVIVSLLYYFLAFNTESDPAPTDPNTTESQQYEDIDELIQDLQ